jgi:hypothetical protein
LLEEWSKLYRTAANMPAGHFDPFVMHNASSWYAFSFFFTIVSMFPYNIDRAEGLTKYKEDKVKPLYDGLTPKPHYVTEYYKKREEIAGSIFAHES